MHRETISSSEREMMTELKKMSKKRSNNYLPLLNISKVTFEVFGRTPFCSLA